MNKIYCIILAGGCGQRLWPLSRKKKPKQFIPFIGQKTLIDLALERAMCLVSDKKNIIVITNELYRDVLDTICGERIGHVIYEPIGRNTAPAILQACLYVNTLDSEGLVVILPADHFIPDIEQFRITAQQMIDFTRAKDVIGLLGLVPTSPATGYGYMQKSVQQVSDISHIYSVERFHEKPNSKTAEFYVASGDMLWNIGIFIGRTAVFLSEYSLHAPAVYSSVLNYLDGKIAYVEVPNSSIDIIVIEKSKKIVVALTHFEWHDVGNLNTFVNVLLTHGGCQSNIISINAQDNIAYTKKKIVACVEVQNLCIIETDDVLVIVDRQKADQIKHLDVLLYERQLFDLI